MFIIPNTSTFMCEHLFDTSTLKQMLKSQQAHKGVVLILKNFNLLSTVIKSVMHRKVKCKPSRDFFANPRSVVII